MKRLDVEQIEPGAWPLDDAETDRLVHYMAACELAGSITSVRVQLPDGSSEFRTMGNRSDGDYIWFVTSHENVAARRVLPEKGFRASAAAREYQVPALTAEHHRQAELLAQGHHPGT